MIIISFDQSSRISGYAVFKEQQLINYGVLNITNPELNKRLVRIREAVLELVNQYQPDKVYLEDIQMEGSVGNNVVTYKALAEVIGVITELLTEIKINYELISPSTWRSKLKLSARLRTDCKLKAQNFVKNTYQVEASEDICDAICIGASTFVPSPATSRSTEKFDWS